MTKNLRICQKCSTFAPKNKKNFAFMTLSTDLLFITDEPEGFRYCRETRTTSSATMTVILCRAGHIDVEYRGKTLRIAKDDLFIRIPDFTHPMGGYKMSPDFAFSQVTIDASIYEQIMFDHMRVEPNWYVKNPIFHINEISIEFFYTYYHLLTLQLQDKRTAYRQQILMLIARGAMMEMLNYIDKLAVIPADSSSMRVESNSSDYTFHAFLQILHQHPHEREVQWYARELGLTPKYLSEICKDRSGKSAGEWIADVTVAEIKHYLRNTTLPIHEIAKEMEFPNASFFCQYTKKHTGLTPNHFRKQRGI